MQPYGYDRPKRELSFTRKKTKLVALPQAEGREHLIPLGWPTPILHHFLTCCAHNALLHDDRLCAHLLGLLRRLTRPVRAGGSNRANVMFRKASV